ncbi:MAG: type III-B CRISPR module RAMP protein Cmr6 [Limisphaerales bacterium]
MARIPMAGDVADLIGEAADKVENRSLLLDKFVFHKRWPVATDSEGRDVKWDEASRWSFLRIADGAAQLLNREADKKRHSARGFNVSPDNQERYLAESAVAESLARVSWDTKDLASLRARHTRRFLGLFRSAYGDRAAVTIGQLEGRLAINLADGLIQNTGISLDRLFGLPFIPGSAIKGVCRHTALEELKAAPAGPRTEIFMRFRAVFGTADNDFENGELRPFRQMLGDFPENQKGAVAFLPAYPVNEARVVVDLTNVHHPEYYRTGRPEDLSVERPLPNPFPAVETGAQFAFCLVLNGISEEPALLPAAVRWLETALTVRGLGAKTASGYGWFSLRPDVLRQIEADERHEAEVLTARATQEAEARAKAEAEARRLQEMPEDERARERFKALPPEEFAKQASALATLGAAEQKGLLLALLTPEKRETWKAWKKSDKPANKARVEAALKLAAAFGVPLP